MTLRALAFFGSVSSLRLAYKDLEIQTKKDEKMNLSGQKKAEAERLGMGFGSCRRYVALAAHGSVPRPCSSLGPRVSAAEASPASASLDGFWLTVHCGRTNPCLVLGKAHSPEQVPQMSSVIRGLF